MNRPPSQSESPDPEQRSGAPASADVIWLRPDGQEMTHDDWTEETNHVLGMLIHGEATDEVDERGRPVFGDTLFLVLNGGFRARYFVLPKVEGLGTWRELLNTASYPETRGIKTDAINIAPHSLVLLRHGERD